MAEATTTTAPADKKLDSELLQKLRTLIPDSQEVVLDMDQIYVNTATNTRDTNKSYDPASIQAMMQQIEAAGGLLHPLFAYKIAPAPERDNKEYCLLAGFRRSLALIELSSQPGKEHYGKAIKCVLISGKHPKAALTAIQLLENLGRRQLEPMEISNGIAEMVEGGVSQKDCGLFFGIDPVQVSNMLKLQRLPAELQHRVGDGEDQVAWTIAREIVRDVPESSWKDFFDLSKTMSHGQIMAKIKELKSASEKPADGSEAVSTGNGSSDQQRGSELIKVSLLKESYLPYLQKKLETADKTTPKYTEADLVQVRLDTLKTVMKTANTQLSNEIAPFVAEQVKAKEEADKNKEVNTKKEQWFRSLIKDAEELYKKEAKPDPKNPGRVFKLSDAIAATLGAVKSMTPEAKAKLGFEIDTDNLELISKQFNDTYLVVAEERAASQKKREETAKKKKEEEAQKAADEAAKAPAAASTGVAADGVSPAPTA